MEEEANSHLDTQMYNYTCERTLDLASFYPLNYHLSS
jgi:hypothetical protein